MLTRITAVSFWTGASNNLIAMVSKYALSPVIAPMVFSVTIHVGNFAQWPCKETLALAVIELLVVLVVAIRQVLCLVDERMALADCSCRGYILLLPGMLSHLGSTNAAVLTRKGTVAGAVRSRIARRAVAVAVLGNGGRQVALAAVKAVGVVLARVFVAHWK